jgi:glycerol-3-phosphate dehydrogenase
LTLVDGTERRFDRIINVAGPWAELLLLTSNISSRYHLDLVRGSHLIIDRYCDHALILEVPDQERIFFVLPWRGRSLTGTTEIRQSIDEAVVCSEGERKYLVDAYNHYFKNRITGQDIVETFAGLRPLLHSAENPARLSREYAFQMNQNLLTVFGGKWTTSMALAGKVTNKLFVS